MVDEININPQQDRVMVRKLRHLNTDIDRTRNARWQPAQHDSPEFFGQDLDKQIAQMSENYHKSRKNLKTTLEAYAKWLEEVVANFETAEETQQSAIDAKTAAVADAADAAEFRRDLHENERKAGGQTLSGTLRASIEDVHDTILDFIASQEQA
ncbi:hypothetical protein B1400_0592 [Bifidobacterium italicum]|uniref:Uncharacterized protein n=1 Tax=Bifidobacterium italicum TaxID=1960968 RepID=A0A2A2EKY6_9BIFI|nr:hypothetical protein [Bifidobacterium italicum]PAU69713.1 hypothetical protein B1400_0592 [Bifidobacterium italicum]